MVTDHRNNVTYILDDGNLPNIGLVFETEHTTKLEKQKDRYFGEERRKESIASKKIKNVNNVNWSYHLIYTLRSEGEDLFCIL